MRRIRRRAAPKRKLQDEQVGAAQPILLPFELLGKAVRVAASSCSPW